VVNTQLLKEQRFKQKMTQMDVANAAGMSQAHYCKIEKGDDSPSLKCLTSIAKALGCSVKELILEE